jgi:hypothetical protein
MRKLKHFNLVPLTYSIEAIDIVSIQLASGKEKLRKPYAHKRQDVLLTKHLYVHI